MADRRLRIGLDFDDTLMSTRAGVVRALNACHGTAIRLEECTDYLLAAPWNLDKQQFTDFFNRHEEDIHTQPPLEGLVETLHFWSAAADFYVVTGRPEYWLPSARRWLRRHEIPVQDVIGCDAAGGKSVVARELHLDFFVEDHAQFAAEIAGAGIHVFLLDRPYNQNQVHPLICRVKDWPELRQAAGRQWPLEPVAPTQ